MSDPRRPRDRGPALVAELLIVALGGSLGGSLRYAIDQAWPVQSGDFPWTTLVINVAGVALLSALLSAGVRVWRHPLDVLFVGAGMLGGFTTMSTFAVQTDRLLADGHTAVGLAYLISTVAVAAAAAHLVRRAVLRGMAG